MEIENEAEDIRKDLMKKVAFLTNVQEDEDKDCSQWAKQAERVSSDEEINRTTTRPAGVHSA